MGFILMISQRLQADLTELATTDTLTQIPNRHATQIFFEKELSHIERYGGEFSILLIDLDNFKLVNDKYGHAVGDIVLLKTSQVFQSAIRKDDFVGRWGSEEFLVILPNTPIENAHFLAENIRNGISTTNFKTKTIYVKLTVSIGIASSNHAATMDDLLKKAYNALYSAKVKKDTVVLAN
jgi:diguanylate cyclase (GGDEF)-like protein